MRKRAHKAGLSGTAALIALSLAACTLSNPKGGSGQDGFLLSKAEYPKMASYPDETEYLDSDNTLKDSFYDAYDAWWDQRREKMDPRAELTEGEKTFYEKSIRELLTDSQGENRVCSPLSLHLALGMLAELTDGNSRGQILSLLGEDSLPALRDRAELLWNTNYCNDGAVTSVLASSLWLNQSVSFVPSTMDSIARHYRASSYQGEMGTDAFNQALQDWLNEQTGGLLKEQAEGIKLTPETILALATTVYFRSKWSSEFSESQTTDGTFLAPGGETDCRFMHQSGSRDYYWGSRFSAVAQYLENNGAMWFLLPDEGISPEELLQDREAMDFLLANGRWDNSKFLTVNLSLPKFDVSSDLDLIEDLKTLGITDVFDPECSDFSPMTRDTDEIFLSQAKHAARVSLDEEGCTAAAYTVMAACGAAAPPEEEIDFVLDRPFLFVITGPSGTPLFTGIVNRPAA